MNTNKDPRQARKMAKEAAKLRKIAQQNPERLRGKELAKAQRELVFENFEEQPREPRSKRDPVESYG